MSTTQTVPTGIRPKAVPFKKMRSWVAAEPKLELIYPAIKQGSVGIIVGPSKSGKTTYMEGFLQHIAAGQTSYLTLPLKIENKRVLMVSFEEYYALRTERQMKQVDKLVETVGNDDWVDNFMVNDETLPLYITTDNDWNILEDLIVDSGAGFVVLDSVTRMCGHIEEADYARSFMARLKGLAHRTKTTIVAIHHTTKLYGGPITMDNIAGSRVIVQESDFAIGVSRSVGNKRYIKDIFVRYGEEDTETVREFIIDQNCTVCLTGKTTEAKMLASFDGRTDDSNGGKIKEYLMTSQNGADSSELEKMLVPQNMSRATLFNQLKKLKNECVLVEADGKYKLAA